MIKKVQKFFTENGMEQGEAKAEAEFLVCAVSGLSIEKIILGQKIQNEDEIWHFAKEKIKTGAPIQHLIGFSYFMGDKFFVNSDVLIPRPETEILVRCAVCAASRISSSLKILDIGTGTGCIAIEISKNLKGAELEVLGVDISTDALRIAIKNMEALGQQRRVIFRKSDIFSSIYDDEKFDIIVSNPPYIPILTRDSLQNEVKNFDPALALFADDKDGVEFYRRILKDAKKYLKPKGHIIFETGFTNGVSQSDIVAEIALGYGFKLEFVKKDLSGINRVIGFYLP